jgi:hypothetical protein
MQLPLRPACEGLFEGLANGTLGAIGTPPKESFAFAIQKNSIVR